MYAPLTAQLLISESC